MRARRVKGLKRGERMDGAVERIVEVRLDELLGFMPKAADPAQVAALHDMRIAAKRLRYVLELTSFSFGPYAERAAKRAKDLQDLIGEIHDCDVTLPRIEAMREELMAADAAELVRRAGEDDDLDPSLAGGAPHAEAWRGLETVIVHLAARRDLLHQRFLELWRKLEREGFAARLRYAITERAQPADSIAAEDG
ncbi:CHAD domain-containing protein [Capillimicrobium parvum]|uniref:CHAD domain-containing protein n=1 Tax=Capillimicrobium parvum TaxID=2884022 RepID=A0A9E6XVC1_9ACTN|nr:CHAD domain-containing protein [Capillimicrobium parvum]UGS35162.1 hypothetical protein DSM104329_01547 [Capillimicrobium parvum]